MFSGIVTLSSGKYSDRVIVCNSESKLNKSKKLSKTGNFSKLCELNSSKLPTFALANKLRIDEVRGSPVVSRQGLSDKLLTLRRVIYG
jgi:hypothetical protein